MVLGGDEYIKVVGLRGKALPGIQAALRHRGLEERRLRKVRDHQTPRFVGSSREGEKVPLPRCFREARIGTARSVQRDRRELGEEHAPRIELVRPRSWKVRQLAAAKTLQNPWQGGHPAAAFAIPPCQQGLVE